MPLCSCMQPSPRSRTCCCHRHRAPTQWPMHINRTLGQNNFTEQPAEKGRRIRRLIERHREERYFADLKLFSIHLLTFFVCTLWRRGSRKLLITRTGTNPDTFRPFKKRTLIPTYTSLSSDNAFLLITTCCRLSTSPYEVEVLNAERGKTGPHDR